MSGPAPGKPGAKAYRLGLILLILSSALVLRAYEFRGFGASDDAAYAQLSVGVARGHPLIGVYDGPAVFPLRVGIIYPTALLFRYLGVSEWTAAALPFVLSLLSVLLAYVCTRHFFGPRAGLLGAALWALLPIDAFHAGILVPDLPAAFYLGTAVVVVLMLLDSDIQRRDVLVGGGLVAGLLLGVSWLSKESVAYAAPFFLFLLIRTRGEWRRTAGLWMGLAVGSAGVLFAEALVYYRATDDWLFHLHETERNYRQYANAFLVDGSTGLGEGGHTRAIVKRLVFSGPWTMLVNRQLGFLPLVAVLGCVHGLYRRDRTYLVPAAWLLTLALMFNFASSSTSEYVPLVLFDRYLYPLLLPSVAISAGFLMGLFDQAHAPNLQVHRERVFWGIVIGAFLTAGFALQNRQNRHFNPDWTGGVEAVSRMVRPSDRIYADILSIHGLEFFWSYPDSVNTVNFEDMPPGTIIRPGAFVLVDDRYLDWLEAYSGWWPTKSAEYRRPEFADTPMGSWVALWSDGNATLYRAGDP